MKTQSKRRSIKRSEIPESVPRTVFVVTEDWYFCSHRLLIARAVRDAGFEVFVVTRVKEYGKAIRDEGFQLIPLNLRRSSFNVLSDLFVLWRLVSCYRTLRPDIVYHVAIKPVIYGSLAARITRVPSVVNTLPGLGFLSATDVRGYFKLLQPMVRSVMRATLRLVREGRVIVQNRADYEIMRDQLGVDDRSLVLIRGSGVDTQHFVPLPEPSATVRITLVSRMLWAKGVGDLVKAAEKLKERRVDCIVTLVGSPDSDNPGMIDEELLLQWCESSNIEWWGQREDIVDVWARSHIACLPSYYPEGVPKSLLEAAACGRPIVTTDNPGCTEIVVDWENGLVVPVKDPNALADALERLVTEPTLRRIMGENGRRIVERNFSEKQVVDQTLRVYEELL